MNNEQPADIRHTSSGLEVVISDLHGLSGFQVVRNEFISHVNEPAISFNQYRFYANMACLKRLPDVSYVQVLVNRDSKRLALRPCVECENGALLWRMDAPPGYRPRPVTCRVFFAMMMQMMEWNPNHRYRLLGKLLSNQSEKLLLFDLRTPMVFPRVVTSAQNGAPAGSLMRPIYPRSWEGQFGLPPEENRKSLQISVFDGLALLGVSDETNNQTQEILL